MRVISISLVLLMVFTTCSPSKKSTQTGTIASPEASTASTSSSNTGNDGSGYDKAVIIDKTNEMTGVADEYKWLDKNYPGYTMISQSLNHKGNKSYDVLHIKTKAGEIKDVYFDITKFFGKF